MQSLEKRINQELKLDFIQDFTGCDCTGPLEKELKQSNICGCSEPPLCHQPARSLLQDWIGDQKKFLKILENLEKNYPPSLPPEAHESDAGRTPGPHPG